jgi:hypothetical protein
MPIGSPSTCIGHRTSHPASEMQVLIRLVCILRQITRAINPRHTASIVLISCVVIGYCTILYAGTVKRGNRMSCHLRMARMDCSAVPFHLVPQGLEFAHIEEQRSYKD